MTKSTIRLQPLMNYPYQLFLGLSKTVGLYEMTITAHELTLCQLPVKASLNAGCRQVSKAEDFYNHVLVERIHDISRNQSFVQLKFHYSYFSCLSLWALCHYSLSFAVLLCAFLLLYHSPTPLLSGHFLPSSCYPCHVCFSHL